MNKQKLLVLKNQSNQTIISPQVEIAQSFKARLVGCLGKTQLPQRSCLWIDHCSSIHTFFMKFSLDLIFVRKDLIVQKVFFDVPPWRLKGPIWRAESVFEFESGSLRSLKISQGDQLDVGY